MSAISICRFGDNIHEVHEGTPIFPEICHTHQLDITTRNQCNDKM